MQNQVMFKKIVNTLRKADDMLV